MTLALWHSRRLQRARGQERSAAYLCKIAMDIGAKHIPADENGVRIAELDEMSYRRTLWDHRPLTDFWRVGRDRQLPRSQMIQWQIVGNIHEYLVNGIYVQIFWRYIFQVELRGVRLAALPIITTRICCTRCLASTQSF